MEFDMLSLNEILNLPDRGEAFYQLAEYYRTATENERENIRNSLDLKKEWVYPNYKTLAVSLPGERSCEERIRASLIFDSIEEYKVPDFRETLIGFCLTYHCAKEIGLDPNKLFEEVAKISSPNFAKELKKFIDRPEEDKSLEAFGLERIIGQDDKVYFKMKPL
jgi:hypothetical protein